MSSSTRSAIAAVSLALAAMAFTAPHASAEETAVDITAQCAAQYPASLTAAPATALLVAPGDAYSWRCEQRSRLPGGGLISNLPVDINAYCGARGLGHAAPVDFQDPYSWKCHR
ncbi:hypothetical protein [Nocardia abscessus]|uniref:hypothetical protein n=1 Tax=Nocardia abscessus TaxID=120957 RepID=UPI002457B50F|nr:hypothetical protein [Nocardia abscessus]